MIVFEDGVAGEVRANNYSALPYRAEPRQAPPSPVIVVSASQDGQR